MVKALSVSNKLEKFFSHFKSIHYRKHEIVIRADDTPQGVYYVKEGFVRLYVIFEDGRELTLNIFKPGSYFSMIWAIADIPNAYYFQTMTETLLQRVSKSMVIDFIKKNPDVLFEFTKRILIGLDGLLANIGHLLSGSAYDRVIAAILLSARRFGEKRGKDKILIKLSLTHQDIANLAGITRETASIAMNKLKRKKILSYDHHLLIINNIRALEKEPLLESKEQSPPHAL